jgi:hypothetical protein
MHGGGGRGREHLFVKARKKGGCRPQNWPDASGVECVWLDDEEEAIHAILRWAGSSVDPTPRSIEICHLVCCFVVGSRA